MILPFVSESVIRDFQSARNILISGDITPEMALRVMLLIRDMDDGDNPIWLIIDSPGGDVQSGWTIVDSMRLAKSPVNTVCYGQCASIAALIFACGRKGGRLMLKHSRFMIHQPWGTLGFAPIKESDLRISSDEMTETRNEIESELSKASGLSIEAVHRMCDDDSFMRAEQAIRYGFADGIIE